jgi:hypothetical protein
MSDMARYSNYKYQSGVKEGHLIHPEAVDIAIEIFGFGITNSPWNNYHDTVLEQLSDAICHAEALKQCKW